MFIPQQNLHNSALACVYLNTNSIELLLCHCIQWKFLNEVAYMMEGEKFVALLFADMRDRVFVRFSMAISAP